MRNALMGICVLLAMGLAAGDVLASFTKGGKGKSRVYNQVFQVIDTHGAWYFAKFRYQGNDDLKAQKEKIATTLEGAYKKAMADFKAGKGEKPLKPSYKLVGHKVSRADKDDLAELKMKLAQYKEKAKERNEAKGIEGDKTIRELVQSLHDEH